MPQNKIKNKDIIAKSEHVFFPELRRKYTTDTFDIRKLGTGTTGVVYQVSPTEVVKVMPSARYIKQISWYKETLYNLKTLGEKRQYMHPYQHFYMHSTFDLSDVKDEDGTPKFIYEKMGYLPMDLETFSKKHEWVLQDFIDIMCQVMHGMRLFHTLQYILTDLKVQNILYNPETKQLKLSDFCESYNTYLKPPNHMYTYFNRNNERGSKKEDVWRLGILMLNFMLPKVNALLTKANKPILPAFLNTMKVAVSARPPKPYQYNMMVQPYLQSMCQTLMAHCDEPERPRWKGIFHIIEKMMHESPDQRPAVRHILASSVFCDSCLIPRVSYVNTTTQSTPKPSPPPTTTPDDDSDHQSTTAIQENKETDSAFEPDTTEPESAPTSASESASESESESATSRQEASVNADKENHQTSEYSRQSNTRPHALIKVKPTRKIKQHQNHYQTTNHNQPTYKNQTRKQNRNYKKIQRQPEQQKKLKARKPTYKPRQTTRRKHYQRVSRPQLHRRNQKK